MHFYTAHDGTVLELRQIPRRVLDGVLIRYPQPSPPVKTRTVWGGMEEDYLDYDDLDYVAKYNVWLATITQRQFDVIAQGVELPFVPEEDARYRELRAAMVIEPGDEKTNCLRYFVLDDTDFSNVTQIILYLSTVTQRGIDEASRAFDVLWSGQPLDSWNIRRSRAKYSALLEQRTAARFSMLTWDCFIDLSGPEQSAIVAYYRIVHQLEWLEMNM